MNAAVVARTGWRIAVRSLWSNGRPRRGALPLVLTLAMAIASGWVFDAVFRALAGAGAPEEAALRVLGWAFTLSLVMLVLGDLHVVVSALVHAPDLERLRAAPLSPGDLLALKLGETLPRTLPPVVGVALPAALAFCGAFPGASAPAALGALPVLWALPLGLGSAAALPLLRVAPASRLRESLAVMATFAFVAGWLANAFWLPRLAGGGDMLAGGFRALPAPPAWSPGAWAAAAIASRDAAASAALAACLAAAAGSLALAAWSASRLLGRVQESQAPGTLREVRARARPARTLALAFLGRDAALVMRDWPVLLDALASLALWTLLPLAVLPLAPLPRQELVRDMLVMLSVSLGSDVAARALPLEREALAWARLSPVGGARWLWLRAQGVAIAGALAMLVALAIVGAAFRLDAAALADAAAFALGATATAMASGMLVGAALGDPAWTDPRAMLGLGGRSVAAAVLLAEAAGWLALSHRASLAGPLAPASLAGLLLLAGAAGAALLTLAARVLARREVAVR